MSKYIFEPEAQEFVDSAAQSPPLYELGPGRARKVFNDIQAGPIEKPDVDEKRCSVPAEIGAVRVRTLDLVDAEDRLPAILYVHGDSRILGDAGTNDRLVRELTLGVHAAVVDVRIPGQSWFRCDAAPRHRVDASDVARVAGSMP